MSVLEELNHVAATGRLVGVADGGRIEAPISGSLDCDAIETADSTAPDNLDIGDAAVPSEDQIEHHRSREALIKDRAREVWRWFGDELRVNRARSEEQEHGDQRRGRSTDMALLAHAAILEILLRKGNSLIRTEKQRIRTRFPLAREREMRLALWI
ncbi:MAG: hypothetical protein ABIR71_12375 [Chthoniobacterales bacterium]